MRKRIKKKTEALNKITSTQEKPEERKMSINLMDHPLTDKDKNNSEEKTIEKLIERTESEENLLNAIKETDNLRNKLKEKKEELESNKIKEEAELLLINKNIKDKSEKLANVSNKTKILLSQLNILNNQINENYNKLKIFQAANKIKIDNLNDLKIKDKKKINQGKKIILLNNKIIDKYKIQKEKLEKLIEEDNNSIINDLNNKLVDITHNEKNITNEINNLRLMKKNHEKKCILINEDLNNTLERIKNEYNDEYKSKNNNNKVLNFKGKETYSSSFKSLPKIIANTNNNNLTIQTNDNKSPIDNQNQMNSNKLKLTSRNYKSLSNIFGEDYLIQKDLKELKDNIRNNIKYNLNRKLKRYITNYSERKKNNSRNNKNNEKKELFSKVEKDMLSKIIPKECLKKYQDKFKTIEDERIQIKEKLDMNEKKKKLNKEKSQLLFISEKKDNNLIKKNTELNYKILIIKRKLSNIIKDIKIIQKGLTNINEKYSNKKEENDKLKNHWTELNDDIKNNKISVKKGEIISKNELDFLNKWGNNIIISQKKHKISNEETCDNNFPNFPKKMFKKKSNS